MVLLEGERLIANGLRLFLPSRSAAIINHYYGAAGSWLWDASESFDPKLCDLERLDLEKILRLRTDVCRGRAVVQYCSILHSYRLFDSAVYINKKKYQNLYSRPVLSPSRLMTVSSCRDQSPNTTSCQVNKNGTLPANRRLITRL